MSAKAQLIQLRPGQVVAVGGKLYGRCADCDSIVRMDKWILGDLHICLDDDERAEKERKRPPGRRRH